MATRNASCEDAGEKAQNEANFGASSTHDIYHQDEGGHVTFHRSRNVSGAAGPNHMDANFIQVMEQVVGGLYVQDVGEGEHNDGEVDPLSVMEEAKDGEEEQSWSLSSLEGEVANHNNQQCGGHSNRQIPPLRKPLS
jgi:hypothetical protein